jgi:hypothetical protein
MADKENEVVRWVRERRQSMQEAREMRQEGEVGIFWVLKENRLLVSSVPHSLAEEYANFLVWNFHEQYWEALSKYIPTLQGQDYTAYPRGRVSYDLDHGVFRILGSQELLSDQQIIAKVKKEFNLTDKLVELLADEHYEPPA